MTVKTYDTFKNGNTNGYGLITPAMKDLEKNQTVKNQIINTTGAENAGHPTGQEGMNAQQNPQNIGIAKKGDIMKKI